MNATDFIAAIERLAAEVNRDMPSATLGARLAEAMKRNRGSMNPLLVREALLRTKVEP